MFRWHSHYTRAWLAGTRCAGIADARPRGAAGLHCVCGLGRAGIWTVSEGHSPHPLPASGAPSPPPPTTGAPVNQNSTSDTFQRWPQNPESTNIIHGYIKVAAVFLDQSCEAPSSPGNAVRPSRAPDPATLQRYTASPPGRWEQSDADLTARSISGRRWQWKMDYDNSFPDIWEVGFIFPTQIIE